MGKKSLKLLIAALFIVQNFCIAPVFAVNLGGPESTSNHRYQWITGTKGMVVSDDRVASEWGTEILRQGGNAIDAAVATAFALAVTRPHYASLGGGGFMVYCPRPKSDGTPSPCRTLDYRETAPAHASKGLYIQNGKPNTDFSQNGPLASGTPGVTSGLLTILKQFGTFPRQKLLTRPIELAKKGFRFSTHSEQAALNRWSAMNPAAKKIFGCGPEPLNPCPPGTLVRQPDLARVLERISRFGESGFYEGPVAHQMIQGLKEAGGILTAEDFKNYHPHWRDPVRGKFKDFEVNSMPPPSAGGVMLIQLLHYMEKADQQGLLQNGFGSVNAIHAVLHAMSLSYADRATSFGDPDFVHFPTDHFISKEYLDERWKTFRKDRENLPKTGGMKQFPESQHTTHFSVMDREGNAVAITTTVNDNFGSGFVPPGTGIVMNNVMDDFSLQTNTPNLFGLVGSEANSIQPGKRPLSSMTPTIVRDAKGNALIAIGAAGGPRITTSVFQSLLNRLSFGMSLTDAVASPRLHHQWVPDGVNMERYGFAFETRELLKKKGYKIQEVPSLGKVHALEKLPNGRVSGAPDPRGEGAAVAEN